MISKNDSNKDLKIDKIAEQWVNLVLTHVRAKKLTDAYYKQQMSKRIKKGIALARINKNNHG